jgi:sugar-phosphatase
MSSGSSGSIRVEAVLFDMDGTIVDSSIPVQKAWRAWSDPLGIDFTRVLEVMHGRRAIETMRILAPQLPQPETADRFLIQEALEVEGIVEIPGAGAFIASLPVDRWGVVTSAIESMARDRIRAAGLPDPRVLISADMVARGKPDPECFLRAAELLGVDPKECLAFEDAPAGIAAAEAAGMMVVGVETHFTGSELAVTRAIPDFSSVVARLESSGGIWVDFSLG